ncbi:hypothetical protein LY76DRAFT_305234 [Colletotrichum caudatum]|nr:hypothetical protein LY76DRAFT_305234 [Colletotrichum caudatum]
MSAADPSPKYMTLACWARRSVIGRWFSPRCPLRFPRHSLSLSLSVLGCSAPTHRKPAGRLMLELVIYLSIFSLSVLYFPGAAACRQMTDLIPRLAWIGGHPAGAAHPGRDIGPIHNQPSSTFSSSVPVAPVFFFFFSLPSTSLDGTNCGIPSGKFGTWKKLGDASPKNPAFGAAFRRSS